MHSAGDLRSQLVQAKPQIDRTISALNRVTQQQSDSDVRSANKAYSSEVDEMTDRAQGVRAEADEMERDSLSYFRQWDRELMAKGASSRDESASARSNVADKYGVIQSYMQNLKQRYRGLALKLADIRDRVAANPTAATTKSLSAAAEDARREALDVQQSIDVLVAELDKIKK